MLRGVSIEAETVAGHLLHFNVESTGNSGQRVRGRNNGAMIGDGQTEMVIVYREHEEMALF